MIPDLRISPYVSPPQQGPTQEFSNVLDQRIQSFDTNAEISDALGYQADILGQQVAPFEGDRQFAKGIIGNTRKQIEEFAQAGDYENMGRQVKKAGREFAAQTQPLLENKQRYSQYLADLDARYKKGDFGLDTYTKAKAASVANYKGYNGDPSSMFSGFDPSKDVNVSDKVDKYLQGWKDSGATKIIRNSDGSYIERNWDGASEDEIQAAAQDFLHGDSEYGSYRDTQLTIGNEGRLVGEVANAVTAGMLKYGHDITKDTLHFEPEHYRNEKNVSKLINDIAQSPASPTINPAIVDVYDAQGLKMDVRGNLTKADEVFAEKDGYYMYIDKQGKPHSKSQVQEEEKLLAYKGIGIDSEPSTYKKVKVGEGQATAGNEEMQKFSEGQNANRFLVNAMEPRYKDGKLLPPVVPPGSSDELIALYMKVHRQEYDNPSYKNETFRQYKEGIKNSGTVNDIKRWDLSLTPGGANPTYTDIKDTDILTGLTGKEVGIMSTNIDEVGGKGGEKVDINSLLEKINKQGYQPVSFRKNGPVDFNTFTRTDEVGMSWAITLEGIDKADKKPSKVIEIVSSIQDDDLRPVQQINRMLHNGGYGTVPFHSRDLGLSGQLRLISSTVNDAGKIKFKGKVDILDAEGNKMDLSRVRGFEQYRGGIPVEEFGEIYQKFFAPNALVKHLDPKFRSTKVTTNTRIQE